jgi:hypothetical protein
MTAARYLFAPVVLSLAACAPGQDEPPPNVEVEVAPADTAARTFEGGSTFDVTLGLQGVTFRVTCSNAASINTVTVTPSGLRVDNAPILREIDGTVRGAEVADLNADGSPEVYVYVTSVGSGSYGSLVAFAAEGRKSLAEISLPPLDENEEAWVGYMGHDEFTVLELQLGRRFPIYREGDTNAEPTGGMRQLEYRLEAGEAGWILRLDRVSELSPMPRQAG